FAKLVAFIARIGDVGVEMLGSVFVTEHRPRKRGKPACLAAAKKTSLKRVTRQVVGEKVIFVDRGPLPESLARVDFEKRGAQGPGTRKRDLALVSRLARQSGGFAWVKRDGNVRWRKIDTFAAFGMIGLKQIARRQSILRWREFAKRYRSLGDRARAYEANQLIARLALGRKPRC